MNRIAEIVAVSAGLFTFTFGFRFECSGLRPEVVAGLMPRYSGFHWSNISLVMMGPYGELDGSGMSSCSFSRLRPVSSSSCTFLGLPLLGLTAGASRESGWQGFRSLTCLTSKIGSPLVFIPTLSLTVDLLSLSSI